MNFDSLSNSLWERTCRFPDSSAESPLKKKNRGSKGVGIVSALVSAFLRIFSVGVGQERTYGMGEGGGVGGPFWKMHALCMDCLRVPVSNSCSISYKYMGDSMLDTSYFPTINL